jgi:hypothetical protein
MKFSYTVTDAGRAAAGFAERSDCAVRSLALSTGMPYARAHEICADAGRRPRGVMRPKAVSAVFANYEAAPWVSFLDQPAIHRPTVAQLACRLPTGSYIFKLRGHVFAVVNGVCMDCSLKPGPRRRVEGFWTMMHASARVDGSTNPQLTLFADQSEKPAPVHALSV